MSVNKKITLAMRNYLIVFVLFSMKLVLSQELPNLSPQSPNAYQFTKYGEVNVNESTGAISPSIPLYVYNAGGIDIPISLNYSGNGVKIAQQPTWVGVNWNMMPGGVITRQVRDLPDEVTNFTRKSYSKNELDALSGANNYSDTSTQWYSELYDIASSSTVDSEADIFNYNFLGYSGSFYLDKVGTSIINAHLLDYNKELEIKFTYAPNNQSYIIIKTPNGDAYFFGNSLASDSSKTFSEASSELRSLTNPAQNAFYLYEIVPYNGGWIRFDYEQINSSYTNDVIDVQESLSKREDLVSGCGQSYIHSQPENVTIQIESLVVLKKISSYFNSKYVEFSSSYLGNRKRKLNAVIVKDGTGNQIKNFSFEYQTEDRGDGYDNKFYLKKVKFLDKNSVEIYDYELEYNNPELIPHRWSFSQDINGYYNGITNPRLLPEDSRFANTIPLANRETNGVTIQYGSLKKITYPTGGYTFFDYESPIKDYVISEYEDDDTRIRVYQNNHIDGTDQDYQRLMIGGAQGDAPFSLNAGQTVTVSLSTTATGTYTHTNYINVYAATSNGDVLIGSRSLEFSENNTTNNAYSDNFTFNILTTGSYYFKLKLELQSSAINADYPIFATAEFDIPNNDPSTNIPVYYPSLRVQRVSSYSNNNSSPIIKRYYYNSIHALNDDNSTLMASPNFVSVTQQLISNCAPSSALNYLNLSANSINNMYADDSQKILYPIVTTSYGGDNFELGAKQSIFRVYPEASVYPYFGSAATNGTELKVPVPYATSGLSDANATLLDEKYFTYTSANSSFNLLKHIEYLHVVLPPSLIRSNIKPGKVVSGLNNDIREYNFSLYNIYSKKNVLKTIKTYDYLLGEVDSIATEQSFKYDDYVDRYSSIITTDSKGKESKQELFYPIPSLVETADLTTAEIADIESLATDHNISQPYLTKTYYDSQIMSSNLTVFSDDWSNGLYWPKLVKTAKAKNGVLSSNEYDERLEFKNYNSFGRPSEVSLTGGSSTRYSYNSNQQVILKIENYNIADMNDGIPTSSPCYYQETYPTSLVTVYEYDPDNGNLISTLDAKCRKTFYEYDKLNRLKQVKDNEDKILSTNDYHYKSQ